ncbi:MAG TPA: hypothetical protein VNQ33_02345, partial [Acidimicrobiales bacterium]|nr:hypothetical protein [Acidimicrobiales bacterium]
FVLAVDASRAAIAVRLTADCPLTDPYWVDATVEPVAAGRADLAHNAGPAYVRGFDVEAVATAALRQAAESATAPHERVHVTPWLYEQGDRFRIEEVAWPDDGSDLRLTVDTDDDLAVVRAVCDRVPDPVTASWQDFVAVLRDDPALAARNAHVRQKDVGEG